MGTRLKKFFKNNYRTIGSVAVVAMLVISCAATLISRRMNSYEDMGRMISIDPLYDQQPMAPRYSRASYTSINSTASADSVGIRDEVGAYSDDKHLTEQQKRDKEALESLIASNATLSEEVSAGDSARDRRSKYKLNDIVEVNNNITVTINTGTSSSDGNSAVGTAQYSSNANGSYLGQFVLTGYCPCVICCGKTNGITASGKLATSNHTIAADSRYAFGTQMIINGQVYTVEDRGGAIKGNHIDIFFNSHSEALAFGKKTADVYLYTGSADSEESSSESSNEESSEESSE